MRFPTLPIEVDVEIHLDHEHHRKPHLGGPIGPFTEQEIPMPNITGVSITDSQQFPIGPFHTVDKRGREVGPSGTVTCVSSDPLILETVDNGDGTFLVKASNDPNANIGEATVTVADENPATGDFVLNVTVTVGPATGLVGTVGEPVEQP